MQQNLAFHALEADAHDLRRPLAARRVVKCHAGKLRETLLGILLQFIEVINLLPVIREHFFHGRPHTGHARHIFRTRPQAALLAAAVDQGLNLHTAVYIEEPGSLGAVQLMGADAQKVDALALRPDVVFAVGLDRIHMEQCFRVLLTDDP